MSSKNIFPSHTAEVSIAQKFDMHKPKVVRPLGLENLDKANNKKLSDEGKDGMNIDKEDDDGDIMGEELVEYGSDQRVHFSQEELDHESHEPFGETVANAQGVNVKDLSWC